MGRLSRTHPAKRPETDNGPLACPTQANGPFCGTTTIAGTPFPQLVRLPLYGNAGANEKSPALSSVNSSRQNVMYSGAYVTRPSCERLLRDNTTASGIL